MYRNFGKRVFDSFFCLLLIIPISLITVFISIAIKIDTKGPVFFKQERLGLMGNVFKVYKFRTMVQNAESIGTGIYTNDQDPRITKIGHILRKTSLDELPQLLNILKGEMSFIGPRPPVPYHPYKYEDYSEIQKKRFDVKPGITGMAQAYGRNSLTWDERIEYDVEYVNKMSLILDLKIILKTFTSVVRKEGVYRG
ncbi:sugar transferase [Aquisalibacillus elongatus]|uniref:Lipopolysaccharide/colanic/teichoic acid biosynthesis glycosyltransferase n=1 Tax=Aquisalibacillus elongatus TaxID=485577 RepID=A0A3N5C429_9BACI|nr:sugar transferase [Aquisalibacillus elongatus]RPF54212.1 lipopolysaccharide/colanic/teichoic acid biosynthesis glycosyltransferase [Aquisalibacillus elongatus]